MQHFTIEQAPIGPRLVLHTAWSTKIERMLDIPSIAALDLNIAKGWKATDLSILDLFTHIRSLELTQDTLPNDSSILQLHRLTSLSLGSSAKNKLDLCAFPDLEELHVDGYRRLINVNSCKRLRKLYAYRAGPDILEDAQYLPSLEQLSINRSPLTTLRYSGESPPLKRLSLFNLTKLQSLDGIGRFSRLEELNIEACRFFHEVEPLGIVSTLRLLSMDDCGQIRSILPILDCKCLERVTFSGTTVVEDGNVSALLDLPKLGNTSFKNRRACNMKLEEICSRLKADGRYKDLDFWWEPVEIRPSVFDDSIDADGWHLPTN